MNILNNASNAVKDIFKSTEKRHGPHNSRNPVSTLIPENIRAFRTITQMLSLLPRTIPIEARDNLLESDIIEYKSDRQETRISDALAHLLVGEHDVIALSTNRRSAPDGGLQVIGLLSESPIIGSLSINSTQEEDSWTSKLKVWAIRITRNFLRDDEIENDTSLPIINSPSEPNDLEGRTPFKYMMDLELCW